MDIVVMTSARRVDRELEQIEQLLESGLSTLHIRKPKWTSEEMEELLQHIPSQFHDRIIVHGHYHLAIKYRLKGVHLHRKHRAGNWKNRLKKLLLRLKRPGLLITTTFNSLESLRDNTEKFDYVFLSSVFNSHSYYNEKEEAGMNMLRKIISSSNNKVFALGGITANRMAIVESTGFSGVALSSAIWKNFKTNPEQVLSIIRAA